jgi:hypothetical protein
MKAAPYVLALLGIVAGALPDSSPQPATIDLAEFGKRSPLCDCGDKCKCAEPCLCNTIDQEPLKAGPPPDVQHVAMVAEPKAEVKFTEPAPRVSPPAPKPQVCPTVPKKAAAAPAGRYEMRQTCGPGGCSVQRVWVPYATQAAPVAQQSACANGSCGVRRGLFGRRR